MKYLFRIIGMPVLMAATFGCGRTADTQENAGVRVSVVNPVRKTLTRTTTQPARIEAYEETPLYAKLSGYVKKIRKDIGEAVKTGEVLVTLWVPEMEDEFKQLAALVKQRHAEQNQATASIKTANAAIKSAQARVSEAHSAQTRADGDFERWKAELKRISDLVKSRSLAAKLEDETRQQFQSAAAARQEAAAKIGSADAALAESHARKEKAVADKQAADARFEVAERNRDRMKTLLGYAEIKAPFDGTIVRRTVDTGHFVQPGDAGQTKPLLVVARSDKVRIVAEVPEIDAPFVRCEKGSGVFFRPDENKKNALKTLPKKDSRPLQEASEATILVQALPGQKIAGTVTRTGWALNPANRTLRVEIDLDNKNGPLRPGMFATATIVLEKRVNVLSLPAEAVFKKNGKAYCCCVKDGKIVHIPVTIGLRTGQGLEITAGLSGDEAVVASNPASLSVGRKVRVAGP